MHAALGPDLVPAPARPWGWAMGAALCGLSVHGRASRAGTAPHGAQAAGREPPWLEAGQQQEASPATASLEGQIPDWQIPDWQIPVLLGKGECRCCLSLRPTLGKSCAVRETGGRREPPED